ncbi:hypothetical protein J2Q11_13770 [Tenacibaculum finnmarkense genomovar finnmarkense]|uniref:hypothetical protein n=1 Tax=Tenacibaculum finnmarkense TaxID=2781243 RepID=UPI001E45F892|nr:hypothetical protein [Tenacibaculum finnmarkense]MCD8418796.1 hypothetical protein [Tenacibaculum finnmarkense genomovar finnmarkense]MCG8187094.1 hypothetical protein [Tenacibaculum finnmarkense genomovar finnmarkense]MCG8203659.1 hypothetical protein [Tenacibaculum finnmarkense genomovar finnmarkense]MCG8211134.1 hypothetical protein [Tenacibaculum finnmarkense genomovar finnmarkense]MCG8213887.1 hypothetical protein [Tenacibaculum finnmarkense genomovar finnmarkense]
MKNLFILALLLLNGCKTKPLLYQGYVYYDNQPLVNVVVKKEHKNQDLTKTDSTGYFKIKKTPNSLTSLIFIKEGFKIDTVPSVWSQHGEKINYTFLNKKFDTIRLRKTLPNRVDGSD